MPLEANVRRDPRIPGAVHAATVAGVPVRFHFTFILLLIFLVVVGLEVYSGTIKYCRDHGNSE